ncbi:MAG TPA: SdiA-regulated domain-containing protein [Chitinophagales bacterium]|nr:SdiA-regulated domain-containing protein [Chitinophagales bacterium]
MIFTSFLIFISSLASLGSGVLPVAEYQLDRPDKKYVLPEILNEVSGLTDIDVNNIACVQDELGIIFIYHLPDQTISNQYHFEPIGDFEGLTRVDNTMYILRSDGRLTEIHNYASKEPKVTHFTFSLFTPDNEGLCHDPAFNRLLIAAKSKPDEPYLKGERLIYSFDLKSRQLDKTPYLRLDIQQIMNAFTKAGLPIRQQVQKDGSTAPKFNFRPSSLAVHPVTDHLYILSASDKSLIVTDRKGAVLKVYALDPALFAKAEGITFLDDGTMFITNEAKEGPPTLLVFNPKKVKPSVGFESVE